MHNETQLIKIKNEWYLITINENESVATFWLMPLKIAIVWQQYCKHVQVEA